MKYKNIKYKNLELKRINERSIKKIINNPSKYQGITIYMLPVNADPNAYFINGFMDLEIEPIIYMDTIDYKNFISEYKYYNCIEDLGKYLKYYINKEIKI